MITETPKIAPLLPERHPQHELFVCDVADAVLKDDMASMEHPFYSLSKKPDFTIRRYEHNGKTIEVKPSARGLATIYDKDILIYCISQIIAKSRDGNKPSKDIAIVAQDMLQFCNRTTGGKDYEALVEALERLQGTQITTNIPTGGEIQTEIFSLIDRARLKRSDATDRILELRVTLSDWVFNAIQAQEVLTLHRDYFRLRRPLERRVYEIARKHCGQQDQWRVTVDLLKKKCGSRASTKEFRRLLRELVLGDHLPDYAVVWEEADLIVFYNRGTMRTKQETAHVPYPALDPETYHEARIVAPGYDVYALEREWQAWWLDSGQPELNNPGKAFIGFCKRRHARNPIG